MRPLHIFVISCIVSVLGFAGCVTHPPSRPLEEVATPPPVEFPRRTDTDTVLAWISDERAFIIVDKTCGTLNLYRHGNLTKSYPAVFGRKPGKKTYEGDQRTPAGLYMIIDKERHNRWSRFMLLDYPNAQDRHQYPKNIAMGKIPKLGAGHPGMGGAVGIHGTDNEAFNRAKINWTLGCISLLNKDVQELYGLVSVGTLVYIKE